jgi:hypothetical protein
MVEARGAPAGSPASMVDAGRWAGLEAGAPPERWPVGLLVALFASREGVGVGDADAFGEEPCVMAGSELPWVLDSPLPHPASAPAARSAVAARIMVRAEGVRVMCSTLGFPDHGTVAAARRSPIGSLTVR